MLRKTWAIALLAVGLIITASGCNRQDAERLGRIGAKLSTHAKRNSSEIGGKVELNWPRPELSLQEKINDRLRFDKALGDAKIEVHVKDKDVELKGSVKEAAQKQRAIDLAESVIGVEKVSETITLREPDEPKPAPEEAKPADAAAQ